MKCTFYRWLFTLMLSTGMHNCNYGVGIDPGSWSVQPKFATCHLMNDDLISVPAAPAQIMESVDQPAEAQNVIGPLVGQPPAPPSLTATDAQKQLSANEEYASYDRVESLVSQDSFPTPNPRHSIGKYVSESCFGTRTRDYVSLPDSSLLADGRRPPIDFQLERSIQDRELHYDSYRLDESEWRCTPSYSNGNQQINQQEQPKKLRSRPADLNQEQMERWKKLWTDIVKTSDRMKQTIECYPVPLSTGAWVAKWSTAVSRNIFEMAARSSAWVDGIRPTSVFVVRPMNIYTFGNGIAIVTPSECWLESSDQSQTCEPQACFPIVSSAVPAEIDSLELTLVSEEVVIQVEETEVLEIAGTEETTESSGDLGATVAEGLAKTLHWSSDWLKDLAHRLDAYASGRVAHRTSNHR